MRLAFRILTYLSLVVVLGCNNQPTKQKPSVNKAQTECKPYFQFDEVEHYYQAFEEDSLWDLSEKEKPTAKEKMQVEILLDDAFRQFSDTSIVKSMVEIGFTKTQISPTNFERLNNLFCERKHADAVYAACIAVYRDVLVFKKNNKIVGTAKICFDCDQSVIMGTTLNTEEFGQSGDYQKLYKILR